MRLVMIVAVLLVTLSPLQVLAVDAESDEVRIRDFLNELDRNLEAVQFDIDTIEDAMLDQDISVVEVGGEILLFETRLIDDLVPVVQTVVNESPTIQDLLSERHVGLAFWFAWLSTMTPADRAAAIDAAIAGRADELRESLTQDSDQKAAIAGPRLAELRAERQLVEELIDAYQDQLDRIAGGGSDADGPFPPDWLLAGHPVATTIEEHGERPPADEDATFSVNHRGSVTEPCWTLGDGLHWCYRDGLGWVGVMQTVPEGLLWYPFDTRATCALILDSRVEAADGTPLGRGHYELCDDLDGFGFTTRGF